MQGLAPAIERNVSAALEEDVGAGDLTAGLIPPGKTAVALHRAAYLLYTYRFPLEEQGVLVIGPDSRLLGMLKTGEATGNCCWGDDGSTLYITADMYLLRIRTRTRGYGFSPDHGALTQSVPSARIQSVLAPH